MISACFLSVRLGASWEFWEQKVREGLSSLEHQGEYPGGSKKKVEAWRSRGIRQGKVRRERELSRSLADMQIKVEWGSSDTAHDWHLADAPEGYLHPPPSYRENKERRVGIQGMVSGPSSVAHLLAGLWVSHTPMPDLSLLPVKNQTGSTLASALCVPRTFWKVEIPHWTRQVTTLPKWSFHSNRGKTGNEHKYIINN